MKTRILLGALTSMACSLVIFTMLGCNNHTVNPSITNNRVTPQAGDTILQINELLPDFDLGDLIKVSDSIIVATVTEIRLPQRGFNTSGRAIIYTDVILHPTTSLNKEWKVAEDIAIRVTGGRIGNEIVIAEDQPAFNLNENVIVFLARPSSFGLPALTPVPEGINPLNYYQVIGCALGKWKYQDGFGFDFKGQKYSIDDIKTQITAILG